MWAGGHGGESLSLGPHEIWGNRQTPEKRCQEKNEHTSQTSGKSLGWKQICESPWDLVQTSSREKNAKIQLWETAIFTHLWRKACETNKWKDLLEFGDKELQTGLCSKDNAVNGVKRFSPEEGR